MGDSNIISCLLVGSPNRSPAIGLSAAEGSSLITPENKFALRIQDFVIRNITVGADPIG